LTFEELLVNLVYSTEIYKIIMHGLPRVAQYSVLALDAKYFGIH